MCGRKKLSIIIIDSLAGLLRYEYNTQSKDDMNERTQYLFNVAQQLKFLSETFNLAVVIVNQVRASF
jgi:RecA/RadA recombinase